MVFIIVFFPNFLRIKQTEGDVNKPASLLELELVVLIKDSMCAFAKGETEKGRELFHCAHILIYKLVFYTIVLLHFSTITYLYLQLYRITHVL